MDLDLAFLNHGEERIEDGGDEGRKHGCVNVL